MSTAELYHYKLPIETGVVLRHRRLKYREGLLIFLTDHSKTGWGEIAPLPEFSHEELATAEQQAKEWICQWQQGIALDLELFAPSVAFGISCALAELHGELGEQGNYRTAPLCYGDPDELYAKLSQMNGEKVAKMKVGLYEANRDGLIANLFLDAIPDLKLRLDANRMWSLEKALLFANKISPENRKRIQFIEEPCQTPAFSRQFAEQTGVAIAWDETVREPDFMVQSEPNLAAIVIKPTLVGSIQKCVSLIEQAHSQGLQTVISSSIESSLGLTQLARLSYQYTPNSTPGLDTLNVMQHQLLRTWQDSNLPLVDLNSPFVTKLSL